MYDKAVNRKTNVHFTPRQTLDFLINSLTNTELTYEVKRRIVRQYLDVRKSSEEMFIFFKCRIVCPDGAKIRGWGIL